MSGSFSAYGQLNKFKGDRDSSTSSRFVMKIDDDDIASQQEQETLFKNEFQKKYVEMCELGQGGSSVVKKCKHLKLDIVRAVKIIRSDDDEYIEISKKEYEVLKSLDSENIVKMHDCIHDQVKGTLYLVMDLVEGLTIEDYVNEFHNKVQAKKLHER